MPSEHDTPLTPMTPVGTGSGVQVEPPSLETSDELPPIATHVVGLPHDTASRGGFRVCVLGRLGDATHVAPPFVVTSMKP